MDDTRAEQLEIFQRLQLALLKDFEAKTKDNSLTAADRAVLVKLLKDNGWTLDATRIPQGLRDRITRRVDPSKFEDGNEDVIGRIA